MSFDLEGFRRAEFSARQEEVDVSDSALAAFFPDDEKALWTVRGLDGSELQECMDAKEKQKEITSILKLVSENKEMADKVRAASGMSDKETPAEMVKRLEMLLIASVNPKLNRPDVVKIAKVAPIEFLQLTAQISRLTGEGFSLVKPEAASKAIAV